MTTGSILFSLALLLLVVTFVARPFLLPAARPPRALPRHTLHARQEALLAQIQALDFDVETGKVLPEDATAEREHLLHQAAEVLTTLENLPPTSQEARLEAAVAFLRQQIACPHCGKGVGRHDKFCAHCGQALTAEVQA